MSSLFLAKSQLLLIMERNLAASSPAAEVPIIPEQSTLTSLPLGLHRPEFVQFSRTKKEKDAAKKMQDSHYSEHAAIALKLYKQTRNKGTKPDTKTPG